MKLKKHFGDDAFRYSGKDLGHPDLDTITEDFEETIVDFDELQRIGEIFNSDKRIIENKIDEIESSNLSPEHKIALLKELRDTLIKLQEQYEREVSEIQKREAEKAQEQIDLLEQQSEELQSTKDSISDINLEAATDASPESAVRLAEEQRQEVDQTKENYINQLKSRIEQAERLRREINSNKK